MTGRPSPRCASAARPCAGAPGSRGQPRGCSTARGGQRPLARSCVPRAAAALRQRRRRLGRRERMRRPNSRRSPATERARHLARRCRPPARAAAAGTRGERPGGRSHERAARRGDQGRAQRPRRRLPRSEGDRCAAGRAGAPGQAHRQPRRAAHRLAGEDFFKLILNQESPETFDRMIRYHRYFSDARIATLEEYRAHLASCRKRSAAGTGPRMRRRSARNGKRQAELFAEQEERKA